jgi:ferrous iron transport protein A
MLKPGEKAFCEALTAGRSAVARLTAMGFVRGKAVTMLSNRNLGPVIVAMGENRLALGRGLAHKVMVCRHGDFADNV